MKEEDARLPLIRPDFRLVERRREALHGYARGYYGICGQFVLVETPKDTRLPPSKQQWSG